MGHYTFGPPCRCEPLIKDGFGMQRFLPVVFDKAFNLPTSGLTSHCGENFVFLGRFSRFPSSLHLGFDEILGIIPPMKIGEEKIQGQTHGKEHDL